MDANAAPKNSSTQVVDAHTWRPSSLEEFISECGNIVRSALPAEAGGTTVLFRGQADSTWRLTSTFARIASHEFDQTEEWYGNRLHQALIDTFSADGIAPSDDLVASCDKEMDAWFELMKRMQQHPQEFVASVRFAGTNLIDWSRSSEVALTFASSAFLEREGAFYVLDAVAAGPVLVQRTVRQILDSMAQRIADGELPGAPLLFCPRRQISYCRFERQQAFYLAQMDLRFPVEEVWELQERERSNGQLIYRRLLLTPQVKREALAYLEARGITERWLLEDVAGNASG